MWFIIVSKTEIETDGQAVGRLSGQREKSGLGCISEFVRCRKLILGRDIG